MSSYRQNIPRQMGHSYQQSIQQNQNQSQQFQDENQDQQLQQQQQFENQGTLIVEDLLQGTQEWKDVPEIVRLTIKALTDVVKHQQSSLRELEKQVPNKASKSEVNYGLQLKANVTDVSRTIAEVSSHLDQKLSFDDSQVMLKDYVLNSDFQYLLGTKVSMDEVREIIEGGGFNIQKYDSEKNKDVNNNKQDGQDSIQYQIQEIQQQIDEIQLNYIQGKDIEGLLEMIQSKADLQDVNEILETKANKQQVLNALNKKVNRSDLEELVNNNNLTNINQYQGSNEEFQQQQQGHQTFNQNFQGQQNQVGFDEIMEKIQSLLDQKFDKNDVDLLIENLNLKAEKQDLEKIQKDLENLSQEIQEKLQQNVINQEQLISENMREAQQFLDTENQRQQQDQLKSQVMHEIEKLKNEVQNQIQNQVQKEEQNQNQTQNLFEKISSQLNKYNEQFQFVQNQLDQQGQDFQREKIKKSSDVENSFRQELYRLQEEIINSKQELQEQLLKKVEKKEYIDLKAKLANQLEQKVELTEVQGALNNSTQDISQRILQLQNQFKKENKNLENDLRNYIDLNFEDKLNLQQVEKVVKESSKNKNEIKQLSGIVNELMENAQNYITEEQFAQHINNTKKTIDMIQKDIILKANIKDVCTLLDTKARIEDVNKSLTEIHKELDNKPSNDDLEVISREQTIINESLCTENIVGRWTWKSGELRIGNLVPWENQVVNTLPDNYIWEKDKTNILIVAPGLYEIAAAFFARKNACAQILLNGDPIFPAFSTPSYDAKQQHKNTVKNNRHTPQSHPNGNITGISLRDFIVLPSRSRISVTFSGEVGVEGFIGLKRL